ncbi:hypothetical protein [Pseudomonas massiliensis]|uniref:hypothetical protein n=1 Tax=Pseudomonas massiliensis TaxID=522492 RepID=UPI0005905EB5|nr:hypothetical protein [Pseudomonas massiliensis]
MQEERLALLLDMLDELAAGRWQVSRKGYTGFGYRRPSFLPDVWVTAMDDPLGHAACAIGYACLDARFEGLYLNGLEPCTRAAPSARAHARLATGWDAVCSYFGLDEATARRLFSAEQSPASIACVRDWLREWLYSPAKPGAGNPRKCG